MKLSASKISFCLMLLTSVIVALYYIEINSAIMYPSSPKDYLINLAMFSVIAYFVFAVLVLIPTSLVVMKLQKWIDSPEVTSYRNNIHSVFIVACVVTILLTFLAWLNH